jgi:hypothetical protein
MEKFESKGEDITKEGLYKVLVINRRESWNLSGIFSRDIRCVWNIRSDSRKQTK